MDEFSGDAAEIVPDAGKYLLDVGCGFLRKRGAKIVAAETMLRHQRTRLAHERSSEICCTFAANAFDRAEQSNRHGADGRIKKFFWPRPGHQNATMIFPNTWRLSSRASPLSKSASGTSVSITGRSPDAILARLSRMLRIEAPNEPMMRYCWV